LLSPAAFWQNKSMSEARPQLPDNRIEIVVLPGGKLPERKSEGAIGYDVYARAIVSETEQDLYDDRLRKTLFDFYNVPSSATLQEHIVQDPDDDNKWAYVLHPGDHALIGVGFATALPGNMMYWLTPRSGLSMRRLTLTNAPGTVDPDYRGEAGALLVNQSDSDFLLQHHSRIAQAVFCPVRLPEIAIREAIDDLGKTERSGGGFGSTGLLG
jgi:dUTP pyrophosphatase